MDVAPSAVQALDGMRLVNRRTGEHTGGCPHCQAGTNRYHVWTAPGSGGRPAGRYWCRACGASGVLGAPSHDHPSRDAAQNRSLVTPPAEFPRPAHIRFYRQLYELTMLWAHDNLIDEANPDPLDYLMRRGLSAATAARYMLGYALHDEQALVAFLTEYAPELMPYAQEAGLLIVDRQGVLRTHWNLCGALIFPSMAEGQITDLRARKPASGAKARSLAGAPRDRGAIYPFGWDEITGVDTVILTESGEFKTLVPLAAYHAGEPACPRSAVLVSTACHPLSAFRCAPKGCARSSSPMTASHAPYRMASFSSRLRRSGRSSTA